jgi:hypothetical protein
MYMSSSIAHVWQALAGKPSEYALAVLHVDTLSMKYKDIICATKLMKISKMTCMQERETTCADITRFI